MNLKINFIRNLKKKKPTFFLIIKDNSKKKKILDKIGIFNPFSSKKKIFFLNINKLKIWLIKGAQIHNKKLFNIIFLILNKKLK